MWTKKEQKAVEFSFKAHKNQKRKGAKISYVSHPMIVGLILAKLQADEDLIIAGILHDVIEDTEFTKKEIMDNFGKEVAEMVDEVSESDRDLPYGERKERATAKLYTVSDRAILIKAADVLSNMTDLSNDLERRGEESFEIFHTGKNQKIRQLERVVKILSLRLTDEELIKKLKDTFKEIEKYAD